MSVLFTKNGNIKQLSFENQLIVMYSRILIAFFLSGTYKGMSYTLVSRCFQVCSNWSMFHSIFQKSGYPENFIDRLLKLFLNRIHILIEKVPTV